MKTGFILEQVTSQEFMRLHDDWGDDRKFRHSNGYFTLKNPITGVWPEEVLEQVARLPHVIDVSVRIPGSRTWRHFSQNSLDDRDVVYDIAHMLCEDPFKRNYFEVILCAPDVGQDDAAVLEFTERDGIIAGYKLRIPYQNYKIFEVQNAQLYAKINALAVPNSQARIQGARVRMHAPPDDQHTARTG